MLNTLKKLLGGGSENTHTDYETENTISDIIKVQSNAIEALVKTLGSKKKGRDITNWFANQNKHITLQTISELDDILGYDSGDKKIATLLTDLKSMIVIEYDLIHNTVYGMSLDTLTKTYENVAHKIMGQNLFNEDIYNKAKSQYKGDTLLVIDIYSTIKGQDKIALLQENDIHTIKSILEKYLVVYVKKQMLQFCTNAVQELVLAEIHAKCIALQQNYPLAKKSRHMFSSKNSLKNELNRYCDHKLPEFINECLQFCQTYENENKNKFIGVVSFFVEHYFSRTYSEDNLYMLIADHMTNLQEEAMANEHNEKIANEMKKSTMVYNQKAHSIASAPTSVGPAENTRNADLSRFIYDILPILGIDNISINDDIHRYILRTVGKNKPCKLQWWMQYKNIPPVSLENRNTFVLACKDHKIYPIHLEDGRLQDVACEDEEQMIMKEEGTDTTSTYLHLKDTPHEFTDLLDICRQNGLTIVDIKTLEQSYDELEVRHKKSLCRLLFQTLNHPHLWQRKKNSYKSLNFSIRHRFVVQKSTIVGISMHGKGYEDLYKMFDQ